MRIFYGKEPRILDVTDICIANLLTNNEILIPYGDNNRAAYFTDPIEGVHKFVYVTDGEKTVKYDEYCSIKINVMNNTVEKMIYEPTNISNPYGITNEYIEKLSHFHSKLSLKHGSFTEEYPEQLMAVRHLTGNEKVLEIGGNIGRNTLIIASILGHNDFVSMECDPQIAKQLRENRDDNGFGFHIENAALSKRKLIQKGWDTEPSETLRHGYSWVNTITWEELKSKYNIDFDTLVLDCEGAFYYILMDMPDILNNIKMIIMENDYHDIQKKIFVDKTMISRGFRRIYSEEGGWGPCKGFFFEVWKI